MLGEDPWCLWHWVCSEQRCRNASMEHLPPGTQIPGSSTGSTDRNVCLCSWVETHRNLEKTPPFLGKMEIAL